jgi:hypothetical protein
MTAEQNELMALIAKEAVYDWKHNATNDRLRRYRVLMREVIRSGDPDSLDAIHDYYGTKKPNRKEEQNV